MNRVTATLSIWSEDLRPEKITEVLAFQPDSTVLKGAERTPPRPRPTAFGWHIRCSKTNVDFPDVVLRELLKKVSIIAKRLPTLKTLDPSMIVNFYLSVAPKSTDIPLLIDKRNIQTIAKFGGSLDIEFFDL